ncbi:M20/M25/M40 family metallo-hydrolase [Halorubrum ezzemoulense]|uniref:M20/M25/M40 family metallo-hydrolase n=1 Tax=Halorubrum ezzemoulense TaxID=337243 RepID=A0ABT4Z203_HALEZ|nr:M20/M25/M40 family metallo-hydrolase [Halorubrum ezzemoulense]MDB2244243.1 M20/M25/M40 family metallo-hydrolase [Halorubrum ezzemoulense]MDB2252311.1 M20/M25/M40 family metallo-hydrolase [Halorubrum ezzemoulense]MDB2277978.1 M20/M25/M40 family metallo-hydrolase [Halorubrum ezzemoulense]MDB2289605.1 M20/M25/M40 family metallo-hydrolase [Halorubrum ezzemoulense]MDB2292186.1 M20/M25/M40 family metallo-hydrolase [Halorubrum ezzemoulense]
MPFDMRAFAAELCRHRSTAGEEAAAAAFVAERLADLGFETYGWDADPAVLADHPSFPDDLDAAAVDGRRSVAGVLELGGAGDDGGASDGDDAAPESAAADPVPTLVLNGHLDVVPAEAAEWSNDPFEPVWRDTSERNADPAAADEGCDTLTARGAADMKCGLAACVAAAVDVRDGVADGAVDLPPSGLRLVVEAVAGEEDGGYGAATAALANPYPFERDAAIVAEPTELRPVVACEGSLMARIEIDGRSAHAATRWRGEDVLPRFEAVREAFADLETERGESVSHPLYGSFAVPWPVVCGRVEAGSWASTVPATLEAEFRIGVAPGETVAEVEAAFRERLDDVVDADPWLRDHPPRFERFSVQFEPAEVAVDEPVVEAVRAGLVATGLPDVEPRGATYGADSRHFVAAGIPAVLFGPGTIDEAHYPDETIAWEEVVRARDAIAAAAGRFARDYAA